MPTPRSAFGAGVINDCIVVFGGETVVQEEFEDEKVETRWQDYYIF